MKRTILNDILGKGREEGDEILFHCPFCNHDKKKLSVNLKKDVAKCWVCKTSFSNLTKMIEYLADEETVNEWKRLSGEPINKKEQKLREGIEKNSEPVNTDNIKYELSIPDEQKRVWPVDRKDRDNVRAYRYLKDRGISDKQILKYRIGYCSYGRYAKRVIIPSISEDLRLNYYVARSFLETDHVKYLTPKGVNKVHIVFNDFFINWNKPVKIVEGVFDAIKAGDNAIAMLGNSLPKKSRIYKKIVSNNPKVYLCLDKGESDKEIRIIESLKSMGVNEIVLVNLDNTDFKDIGEMPNGYFDKYISNQDNVRYIRGNMSKIKMELL